MNRITSGHLSRQAIICVRQSTMSQVLNNPGSRQWQYDLRSRAVALGWPEPMVIDEDLGLSGSGGERPGFDRLLGAVCRGGVGIIPAVDATRLSRNGIEWHSLIDNCGLVGCLLADEQSVHDPSIPSDRLMLGVQGAVSELEASNICRRNMEGKLRKARRGALFGAIAVGHVKAGKEEIVKDPDERVRSVLEPVFRKFDDLQSLRQLMHRFIGEGIDLPARSRVRGDPVGAVTWRRPTCTRVRDIMENPIHAGAYAFGRSVVQRQVRDGRKHVGRRKVSRPEDWAVLIKGAHEGHISWEQYGRNLRVISDNATGTGSERARGAVRRGNALLAGLLRCGHCGRKLTVACSGKERHVRQSCNFGNINCGEARCRSVNGRSADEAVGDALLRALEPIGIEASLQVLEADRRAKSDAVRQAELALDQARYEADRAFRQYDEVDPANRQVAAEPERRRNGRLVSLSELAAALERTRETDRQGRMGDAERDACRELGTNLALAWHHERVTPEIRKRILRAAIVEVLVTVDGRQVRLIIHWQGGDHSEVVHTKNQSGMHNRVTDEETATIITALARQLPDGSIAAMPDRCGRRTAKGLRWRKARVAGFRSYRGIPAYRPGEERERGEIGVREAAGILGINERTVRSRIASGRLPAWQVCRGAPWMIKAADLSRPALPDEPQQTSLFDTPGDEAEPEGDGPT